MKIALLVPSRERIKQKVALINSIQATVDNIDNIVLYFGIDDDDPYKQHVVNIASALPFVKIVEIHNDGKFLGVGKLWNICANRAQEEILAMIGDDMVFETSGWDTKIIEEFSLNNCPKDNIKMVHCNDGRHGQKIAVNLFIHRAYVDMTGYFMREEFMVDFIDLWLQQIFSSLSRLVYRGDILIEHKHWSFRKSDFDSVANNLRGNNYPKISQVAWINTKEERIREAKMIGDRIGIVPDLIKINTAIMG